MDVWEMDVWGRWTCSGEGEDVEEKSWLQLEPAAKRQRPMGPFSNRNRINVPST